MANLNYHQVRNLFRKNPLDDNYYVLGFCQAIVIDLQHLLEVME